MLFYASTIFLRDKMNLTPIQVEIVVEKALKEVGRELPSKHCLILAREVFMKVGKEIPPLYGFDRPPANLNLRVEELRNPPPARLVFLRNKTTPSGRVWTHVVITIDEKRVVHRSRFFGSQVVISTFEEIFQFYDFVPS
jgi:hypothetical protein